MSMGRRSYYTENKLQESVQQRKATNGDSTYTMPKKRGKQTFIKYRSLIIFEHIQNTTFGTS